LTSGFFLRSCLSTLLLHLALCGFQGSLWILTESSILSYPR